MAPPIEGSFPIPSLESLQTTTTDPLASAVISLFWTLKFWPKSSVISLEADEPDAL